jgi:hypothetical protein
VYILILLTQDVNSLRRVGWFTGVTNISGRKIKEFGNIDKGGKPMRKTNSSHI